MRAGFLLAFRFGVLGLIALIAALCYGAITPPFYGAYQTAEAERLGGISTEWIAIEALPSYVPSSVVAAEDANFCTHHGIDFKELQNALEGGAQRGASTITMQVAKNVYLWHGRTYLRKGIEFVAAGMIDTIWSKKRILEVYLNFAEFDDGVFGIEAAAQHYFGKPASALSRSEAARLAAILPAPKSRSAARPSGKTWSRAKQIMTGEETIQADGRADCFSLS